MKRRLFTSLSALSLLLCLAAALSWVRSIWVADFLIHSSSDSRGYVGLTSVRGRLGLELWHFEAPPIAKYGGWTTRDAKQVSFTPNDPRWKFLGFNVVAESNGVYRQIALIVPNWFVVAGSAILPVIWLRRWRRFRLASREGLCPTCGYDLRASKDRCPECGTAIAA